MILSTIAANASIQALTFLTGILAAYVLGPDGRGELAVILLYPQLLASLFLFGVDRATAVLAGQGALNRPFNMMCVFVLAVSVPVMASAWVCTSLMIDEQRLVALADLYVFYVPAVYFYVLAISYFGGIGDFRKYNLSRMMFYVLYPLLIVVLLAFPIQNLTVFVVANLAGAYGALIISFLFMLQVRRGEGAWSWGVAASDLKLLSRKASIFVVPAGLGVFCANLSQLALSNLGDVRALGLFVVYLGYSRLAAVVANALNLRVFQLSIAGNDQLFAGQFRKAFLVHLILSLLLYLAAPAAITLLFGRDFGANLGSARILLVSAVFSYLSDMLSERFKGQSAVRPDVASQVLYLTVTLAAAALMVPAYGLIGMAISVVAGEAARLATLLWVAIDGKGLRARSLFVLRADDLREMGSMLSQPLR